MDMDNIIRIIWDGKDWIFSGIGVAALGFIGNYIIGKVSGENSDKRSKVQDNNNASDGNIITGRGPAAAVPFAFEILKHTKPEKVEEIKKGMLFNS